MKNEKARAYFFQKGTKKKKEKINKWRYLGTITFLYQAQNTLQYKKKKFKYNYPI